jgi:hypothetical protein
LLAPRPTPKLGDHPLSFIRGCLFNIFAATLHNWRPLLHLQPEDMPYCGDRDPPNMAPTSAEVKKMRIHTSNPPCIFMA